MNRFRLSAMLLAGAGLLPGSAALAQSEEADTSELIVIAIKEPALSVQDYPGSISVLGADALEARQFRNLTALSYAAPNASLDEIGTFKGVANFAMRGLGVNSSIPSIDPAVGLFVDGVYAGINAGSVFDALDVERVELLRGPQGVAFGKNTTGGAVLVKTGDPSFDGWKGYARAGLETPVDGGRGSLLGTGRAVVTGPLSDGVAVRLAALHTSDGGYFVNRFNGNHIGASENTVLRGGLALRPGDRLTLTLKGEWNRSTGDGAPTHNNGQNARDRFDLSVNQEGFHRSTAKSAIARADYALASGTVTNLFGWRKYGLKTRNDIDSSPATIFESDTLTAQEQWSNELWYAGRHGGLDLTAGAYLFHQNVAYEETRKLAAMQYGGGRQKHDVIGLYAQGDYALTPILTLTAGLRWTREEKAARVTYVRPRALCSAVAGTCPITGTNPAVPGESNGFADKRHWNSLASRVALAATLAPHANAYASWTRGHRSGGYNLRITQPAAFEQVAARLGTPAFDQERVDSFELGLKWHAPNRTLGINAALFQSEVDNLQREINVPSATSGLAQSIFNTADARIRGGELELVTLPAAGLKLTAQLGYTGAKYRRAFFDINSDGAINAADLALDLPRAPKWTWGLGAEYEAPLGGKASLTARADFQHRSRFAYTDNNWGFNAAADRLDASVTIDLGEPAIRFTVYGRNLLDEVQFGGDTQLPFAGGAFSDGNNRPYDPHPAAGTFSPVAKGRLVGIEVGMDF